MRKMKPLRDVIWHAAASESSNPETRRKAEGGDRQGRPRHDYRHGSVVGHVELLQVVEGRGSLEPGVQGLWEGM